MFIGAASKRGSNIVLRILRLGFLIAVLCLPGIALTMQPGHTLAEEPLALLQAQTQVVELVQRLEPAVVAIARISQSDNRPLPMDFDPFDSVANPPSTETFLPGEFGTGVVVATAERGESRFILTNHHVVTSSIGKSADGSKLWIRTSTRHTLPAQVHAFDPRSDLAVLKVNLDSARTGLTSTDLPPLPYGAAPDPVKGQFILALGNPLAIARDGSCSVTMGLISNINRRPVPENTGAPAPEERLIHHYGTLLHVDTRLPLGMSGGALLDLKGNLIGLTTPLASVPGYERSAGFAISIDSSTARIIDTLIEGLEVEYGFLGITPDDAVADDLRPTRPRIHQPTAARAGRVARGSPAEQGGLQAGDLILTVNDRPVFDGDDLIREVGLLGPGTSVRLQLFRYRTRDFGEIHVTLGKWPVQDDSRLVISEQRHPLWNGLRIDYSTARRRYMTSAFLTEYVRAVVITEVQQDSPAALAGLEPGLYITAVDDVAVDTPQEFYARLPAEPSKATLTLLDGRRLTLGNP